MVRPFKLDEVQILVAELKVNVATGNHLLGGFIASTADTAEWHIEKI